jgi:LruC domain-containing protein
VSDLYFGSSVDGETEGTSYPSSEASDDGVTFATDSQAGQSAVVQLVSSGTGKVDAWIDFNQNQQFDDEEQVLTNHDVSSGTSTANIVVPTLAEDGTTWARFRLSEEGNLAPTGGAQNGEVEDFEVSITGESLTCVSYPSSATYSTVVFEDNWPFMGDFDFNDAVAELRTTRCSTGGSVHVARVNGQITAMGAGYHNGLAMHIPGVDRADVSELFSSFTVNSVAETFPMVAGTTDAVFQLDNDLRISHPKSGGCNFFRTEPSCAASVIRTFELKVALDTPIAVASFPTGIWDPFLYATPNSSRSVGAPGTSLEIHLKNKGLTSLGSAEFFDQGQDSSDEGNALYFQTSTGLPWAIEVPSGWKHPVEGTDISTAYPDFAGFAMSGGAVNTDWYSSEKATSGKFYDQ